MTGSHEVRGSIPLGSTNHLSLSLLLLPEEFGGSVCRLRL